MSPRFFVVSIALASALAAASQASAACTVKPPAGCKLVTASNRLPDKIDGCWYVEGANGSPHKYTFLNVVRGGSLFFIEKPNETTEFRVSALLVEMGGVVQAGTKDCAYGSNGGQLNIGLWGDDPTEQGSKKADGKGISCLTNPSATAPLRCFPANGPDGKPRDYATAHYCTASGSDDPCGSTSPPNTPPYDAEPNNALLEPYADLNFDPNPWGFKTIGVAYGGSLLLYGYKGAKPLQDAQWARSNDSNGSCVVPSAAQSTLDAKEMQAWADLTGTSWVRLTGQSNAGDMTTLTFDRPVPDWKKDDWIVVGATDWNPSHSELRQIHKVISPTQVQVDMLKFPHYTQIFDVGRTQDFTNPVNRKAVDTRAVVGLLSRSIKIYSRADVAEHDFPDTAACTHDRTKPDCYFGGHVIVRQGFKDVQIQGVEFKQLGQGGRMGHYPMHFHMAKTTSYTSGTFVKDSSVWDSMTRFVVLHGTHDVNVSRNVGYLSLGHGYYIEDASEIRNRLCHNLGVSARAGLQQYVAEQAKTEHWCGGAPPPAARLVPPILDGSIQNAQDAAAGTAAGSDTYMPVMYWMMNTYNEFVGNAAVGVHGFGSCFWLLGSAVSGPSRTHQFAGFASYNAGDRQAPLLRFRGNTCSTAPIALPSTREIDPASNGFTLATDTGYVPLDNPYLTHGLDLPKNYARPIVSGSFQPKLEGQSKNCSNQASTQILGNNVDTCVMTVIDRFATSYNWAALNFGSIWLRPWFYLFSNGAVTDQLFGGLGFVTGGDYQQALPGYLALAQNSLFVGTTQPPKTNPHAKRSGPLLTVKDGDDVKSYFPCTEGRITCNLHADGTGLWTGAFNPKRLITIYDGPTYADGNAFLNVGAWQCNAQPCKGGSKPADCTLEDGALPCGIYTSTSQPAAPSSTTDMTVLDAAIGWKQSNGFYYPPAFNYRRNAFLNTRNDDLNKCFTSAPGDYKNSTLKPGSCRHNVVDRTATYVTGNVQDLSAQSMLRQSGPANELPVGTIDFATILLDLDGSLTGATSKIDGRKPPGLTSSVSKNQFFDAPAQSPECLSNGVQTSPYTFITTALGRLANPPSAASNRIAISDVPNPWPATPAVAIYRQWKLKSDEGQKCGQVCDGANYGCPRSSFMGMAAIHQSPFLTMTQPPGLSSSQPGALYYIDTNSGAQSTSCVRGQSALQPAIFNGGDSYVVYNIFPQRDSVSSYQLYVGNVADDDLEKIDFRYVRVSIHEIEGSNQVVTDACNPKQAGPWCNGKGAVPSLKNGILTVTLDHAKLLTDDAFSIAKRAKYEQCMPRDLCYFDDKDNKCRSCLTNPGNKSCLRKDDFFVPDVSSMNRPDAAGNKPLDSVCEDWATMVSGQTTIGGGSVASADCPNGGCLGFAFRLPQGGDFSPQPYDAIETKLKLSRCFLASAWTSDVLVQRKKGPQALDPQCGTPRLLDPKEEFCTDPTLDLQAEKDAVLMSSAPAADGADAHDLLVSGGDPSRSVIAFDDDAVESFVAGGAFTSATLEVTLRHVEGEPAVDAHPLLRDFADEDLEDGAGTGAPSPAGRIPVQRTSRVLGRRLPVIPNDAHAGTTWVCAVEIDPGDDRHECHVRWDTPGGDYGPATAPPALVSGTPGTVVRWDVTTDVMAGVSRWLLRHRDEEHSSEASFHSEESAEAIGDPDLAPRLVLE